MTETISPVAEQIDTQQLAQQLVEKARADGVDLVGPGGLLTGLTKTVLETALDAEMSEHLGYDRHDPVGRNGGSSRNGTRAKTVLTEVGPVEIEVPRDREGSFDPVIVRKRQRRLDGIDQIVLSLTARGLDHRRDRRALRRGIWGQGLQGHHLEDHRQGDRGDEFLAGPAPRPRLSGRVCGRDRGQDPRRVLQPGRPGISHGVPAAAADDRARAGRVPGAPTYALASSTRPDGRPHAAPTLFSLHAEVFWLPTLGGAARLGNVRAYPWLALSILEGEHGHPCRGAHRGPGRGGGDRSGRSPQHHRGPEPRRQPELGNRLAADDPAAARQLRRGRLAGRG